MKNVSVSIVEAENAVRNQSVLSPSVLAAFHLTPTDTIVVQTRKGKNSFKTLATYEAGKSYGGLNGVAAAYVKAENASGIRRVLVPKIDRVLVKFAA